MEYNNPNENWRKRQNYYDRREQKSGEVIKIIVKTLLVCLAFAMFGWILSGCTTTKYVPVISHSTDTLIQTRTQYDSIYMSDSIYISDFVRTDTVFRTVERWHTQYRDRWRHDTIYQARHDTIPQPYPVTEYVEKPLWWWQKGLIWIGIIALMVVIVIVVWKLKRFLPIR